MGSKVGRGQGWVFCLALFCFAASVGARGQAAADTQPAGPFTLKVDVNRVLIPVVVRDQQGHVVEDLKQEEFQILDDGKPRPIAEFQVERKREAGGVTLEGATQPVAGAAATPTPQATYPRFIVLLFDDSHLDADALAMAKSGAEKLLAGSLGANDYAAVLALSGRGNSGMTQDTAKLQQTLTMLRPNTVGRPNSDCPKLDYYQAYRILEQGDQDALQDVVSQLMSCAGMQRQSAEQMAPGYARSTLNQGETDVQNSLGHIATVVQALGKMNGQRLLVLVSPGFFAGTGTGLITESKLIDLANQSGVTISALDARGLYVTALNASDDTLGRSPIEMAALRSDTMRTSEFVMADLADGTGGKYFHNSNDLSGGFQKLAEVPDCTYLVEISLDGVKANGAYHDLKVKVSRPGMNVQARKGYAAPDGKKK